MARIRLATWHGAHAPGSVVEVPDDQVPGLRRDGRVAEVVADEPPPAPVPPEAESPTEPAPRRRRKDAG